MPTATSTFGITLANLGPAPTAITHSPGCPTDRTFLAHAAAPSSYYADVHCYTDLTHCFPEPVDSTLKEDWEKDVGYMVGYYSPGVQCPSGWQTVGVIGKPTKGPVTSSGMLTEPPIITTTRPWSYVDVAYYPYVDAFSLLLDPGETAVACCPSAMTVGENGNCYSIIPEYPVSTACWALVNGRQPSTVNATYPLNGTTTSGQLLMAPTVPPETTTIRSVTLPATMTADYVAVLGEAPIILVHQATDSVASAKSTGNAAPGRYPADTGLWSPSVNTMGILAVSIVAGMAMVL